MNRLALHTTAQFAAAFLLIVAVGLVMRLFLTHSPLTFAIVATTTILAPPILLFLNARLHAPDR